MRISVETAYKSIPRGLSYDLPNFCILTGRNGSGKSHLLEAIASRNATVDVDGVQCINAHYVGFGSLVPQIDSRCDLNQVTGHVTHTWTQVQEVLSHYKNTLGQGILYQDVIDNYLRMHHSASPVRQLIEKALKNTGKKLEELSFSDISDNIDFSRASQNQVFSSQFALIFKAYHNRKIRNEIAEFRTKNKGLETPFLNSDEFVEKFGPAPWVLINSILKRAGLSYEVSNPEDGDFELAYDFKLIDRARQVEIPVNDLSTGEKVLMSLALAIYNTQQEGQKTDILLLDEPDAPLHPQFSKLLIDTLVENIVNQAGVKVILTTHSPSTVSMAPDGTVFEMARETKSLRLVSNSHAVEVLTEGIDYLRVSYENRRQVFVESKYDVQYFERIFRVLSRKYSFQYQPIFLEPHSGSSNCSDVVTIVQKLRSSGSDLAFGVIDFDGANQASDQIAVLGQGSRYAIENYILDPLYVVLSLIRYGKKDFGDFGVSGKHVYTDALSLSENECQIIVNSMLATIGIPLLNLTSIELENGFVLMYPQDFLMHHGHSYEQKLQTTFSELRSISRGQGDAALKLGVLQTIEEFPNFLPIELAKTFGAVIGLRGRN